MRSAWATAAAALLLSAGCGSSTPPKPPAMTRGQAQGLLTRLETVRAAAAAQDINLTEQRLRGFSREVARLLGTGALDTPTAQALTTGAARAAQRAGTEIQPPAGPQYPEAPAPPEKGKGKGSDKPKGPGKKDKGHGKKSGGGGD